MKRYLFIGLIVFLSGCATYARDVVYQYSTLNALSDGLYDGELTYGQLKHHGNFGIGTFSAIDGEMVALDNKFYQISPGGLAYPASNALKTPFATVKFFRADEEFELDSPMDYKQLKEFLDDLLPSENIVFAIKIDAEFSYLKARNVYRQDKPYPPLAKVIEGQEVFKFQDIKGILVGFRFPEYFGDLNATGYHLHFLSADKTKGGHLLDCKIKSAKVYLDRSQEYYLVLPQNQDFLQHEFRGKIK